MAWRCHWLLYISFDSCRALSVITNKKKKHKFCSLYRITIANIKIIFSIYAASFDGVDMSRDGVVHKNAIDFLLMDDWT